MLHKQRFNQDHSQPNKSFVILNVRIICEINWIWHKRDRKI